MEIHWQLRVFCTLAEAFAVGIVYHWLSCRYQGTSFVGSRWYWRLMITTSTISGFLIAEATLTPWLDAACQLGNLMHLDQVGNRFIIVWIGAWIAIGVAMFRLIVDGVHASAMEQIGLSVCCAMVVAICGTGGIIVGRWMFFEKVPSSVRFIDRGDHTIRLIADRTHNARCRFDRTFDALEAVDIDPGRPVPVSLCVDTLPVTVTVRTGGSLLATLRVRQNFGEPRRFTNGRDFCGRIGRVVERAAAPIVHGWLVALQRAGPSTEDAETVRSFRHTVLTQLEPLLEYYGLTPIDAYYGIEER